MPAALPSFAIVTPSFQHRQYLEQTIQSVLSQNYPGLDYWVIDGGSKDGTVELLRQHELRLRWISEPDRGQSDAISKGFAKSRGEILGWLNSDDEYAPGALAAVADIFARHPGVEVVYGNARFIDAQEIQSPLAPTSSRSAPIAFCITPIFSSSPPRSSGGRRSTPLADWIVPCTGRWITISG